LVLSVPDEINDVQVVEEEFFCSFRSRPLEDAT
jgi:hypothetical protein